MTENVVSIPVAISGAQKLGLSLWQCYMVASYYSSWGHQAKKVEEEYLYVLAENLAQAHQKLELELTRFRKFHSMREVEIRFIPIPMEKLLIMYDVSNGMGMSYLQDVELSLPVDQQRFRLGVCLIPSDSQEGGE